MRIVLIVVTIFISFVTTACSTTEQAYESNQNQFALPYEEDTLAIENDAASQSSLLPETISTEQSILVHESLPEFILQLRGTQDTFTELSIVDSTTGAVVYEIVLDDMDSIRKDYYTVEMIDMDFDGYQDIRIFTGHSGTWKKHYIYSMWDSARAMFVGDTYGLAGLGLPGFDAEQKTVFSMQRGSAADHWYYTHQYIDGELVVMEEVSDNLVWNHYLDGDTKEKIKEIIPFYDEESIRFMHHIKKQLDVGTMELVVVEDTYIQYQRDGAVVCEHAPDSEIGLILGRFV